MLASIKKVLGQGRRLGHLVVHIDWRLRTGEPERGRHGSLCLVWRLQHILNYAIGGHCCCASRSIVGPGTGVARVLVTCGWQLQTAYILIDMTGMLAKCSAIMAFSLMACHDCQRASIARSVKQTLTKRWSVHASGQTRRLCNCTRMHVWKL